MKIQIKITKDILERTKYCGAESKCSVPQNCAISLAVRDIAPKAEVFYSKIYWIGQIIRTDLSGISEDITPQDRITTHDQDAFIKRFDAAMPHERPYLNPISFEVEFPDCMVETIGIEEANAIISKSETLELV